MKRQLPPYRVGTARAPQRYIEPDEIYPEFKRGPSTSIPAQFPWTWNPVNGFSLHGLGADASAQNIADDILHTIVNVGQGAAGGASDTAAQQMQQFLDNTPAGHVLLTKVQQKAQEGVVAVVKDNAPNLIMLAVAGGAVGGALSAKLGKTGTVLSIVLAVVAANKLLKSQAK